VTLLFLPVPRLSVCNLHAPVIQLLTLLVIQALLAPKCVVLNFRVCRRICVAIAKVVVLRSGDIVCSMIIVKLFCIVREFGVVGGWQYVAIFVVVVVVIVP
jgi:hypothetical protein